MSKLDDIQAKLDAKMAEIMRRIDADGASSPTPPPTPTPTASATPASQSPFNAFAPAAPLSTTTTTSQSVAANAWPPPPTDDSSQPTLSTKDLYALAPFDISVVGLNPGDPYPYEGKRYPGDPGDPEDEIWASIVAAARQSGIPLGDCEIALEGRKGTLSKRFLGPTVFCKDVIETPSTIEQQQEYLVGLAVSYFQQHWGFSGVQDIKILWTYASAEMDKSHRVTNMGIVDNAYSSYQGNGRTFLCFSPQHVRQDTAGHEFTHAVTNHQIGWASYWSENGTINESLSDIFAQFAAWAWNGRQLSDPQRWIYSGSRDMAHPENKPDYSKVIDKKTGQEITDAWIRPSYYLQGCQNGNKPPPEYANIPNVRVVGYGWYVGEVDNCGVHRNNGVIARLCFLLCEGEVFNRDDGRSFNVEPIGFARTEELFGTLLFGQRRYLPSACNMYAFYNGITLAAQDIGFSQEERDRLLVACDAVNIVPKQASSKFGNLSMEGFSMRNAVAGVPGAARRSYTKILAEALSGELGLHAAGAGFAVDEESVVEMPDLHAAVPTGGEVQVTFSQTWNGLPVFGSYAIARVRDGDRITHFQNGFSSALGQLTVRTSTDETSARRTAESEFPGSTSTSVRKIVFDPALIGRSGGAAVAWQIDLRQDDVPTGMCIVSALDGSVLYSQSSRIVD